MTDESIPKMRKGVKDISGKRFGKLTAVRYVGSDNGAVWEFNCDCGNKIRRKQKCLLFIGRDGTGEFLSCGCSPINFYKHGKCYERLFGIWCGIKKRCYQKSSKTFAYYGARGIKMCDEWLLDYMSFRNWAMDNGYEKTLSIDRINVNGNYEPNNCRWLTMDKQKLNTTKSRMITVAGITKNLCQWAADSGIGHTTILHRIKSGWSNEDAVSFPPKVGRNQFDRTS